ncbi:flagellar biosynthesis protein FlhF [Clostridium oryzae]|uniref:Flagellar biosynthesis protein FlhF n=1 Tax=Clostridium oryzae TaxID=1450648 RepID=A0A1V4ITP3_9CLOT|nr:flagellar biosynthesis protein FlhF [Clostridium oryzae]OPJ63263.1 flagellar biosynthesis protein FlhF [Clostridium oryzae]
MVIKRYLVKNMNEAMTRIRYELGAEAIIISQRKIKKPGFIGLFSKRIIEVTAAVDNSGKEKKKADLRTDSNQSMKDSIDAIKKIMNSSIENRKQNSEAIASTAEDAIVEVKPDNELNDESKPSGIENMLLSEFKEMKSMIAGINVSNGAASGAQKSEIQKKLESNDINEKTAEKIINTIKADDSEADEKIKLENAIKKYINISDAEMNGTIVLVGPTGVGKTTTIAKLAGKLALMDKKKVGLITVDTYRIGAVEQLRTYAEIMNIPFKVVITIKEMEKALSELEDCDVVLVDTTGRSSKNTMQLSELRAFIDKTGSENINLVVSCTTKDRDIVSITEGFKQLNYNNVIITKLDETSTYGSIVNILDIAKKPLNYITTGQNVPDDIKKFTEVELCNLILGEDVIC